MSLATERAKCSASRIVPPFILSTGGSVDEEHSMKALLVMALGAVALFTKPEPAQAQGGGPILCVTCVYSELCFGAVEQMCWAICPNPVGGWCGGDEQDCPGWMTQLNCIGAIE